VTLSYNELQTSTYVADKRLQWARGLPVFLSLFGVCTLLENKLLKIIYILNVNISMTVGRIFTKKIYLYLGLFFENRKSSGHLLQCTIGAH